MLEDIPDLVRDYEEKIKDKPTNNESEEEIELQINKAKTDPAQKVEEAKVVTPRKSTMESSITILNR